MNEAENNSVTVIMSTYNGEKYIKSQKESIVNQMEADGEPVFSDDDSADKLLKICQAHAKSNSKDTCANGPHKEDILQFRITYV